MTKTELIETIKQETELSESAITKVINAANKIIINKVADGEEVILKGFGTFLAKKRAERTGRNPRTGTSLIIEARTVPYFRASKAFKEVVNK